MKGFDNGWSKTNLVVVLFIGSLLPNCAIAAAASPFVDPTLISKLIIAVLVVFLANAGIPSIKHILTQRTLKRSYIAYLGANVESAMSHFGGTKSIGDTKVEDYQCRPQWLDILKAANLEVPTLLLDMHNALEYSATEKAHKDGYIPYISYNGMPTEQLGHEHPIWLLEKTEARVIANFLLSQNQIEKSIADLYSEPLFTLAKSDNHDRRKQWVAGSHRMIGELAEHFINTCRLRDFITAKYH
ncbi:MAG: hypothetical protein ACI8WB_000137 [Phenylobacterium sp.]|jgi:hypothetical protein